MLKVNDCICNVYIYMAPNCIDCQILISTCIFFRYIVVNALPTVYLCPTMATPNLCVCVTTVLYSKSPPSLWPDGLVSQSREKTAVWSTETYAT